MGCSMGHVGTQATNYHVVSLGNEESVHANGDEDGHVGLRMERRCPLERTRRSSPSVGIAVELGALGPRKTGTVQERGCGVCKHVHGTTFSVGEQCAKHPTCIHVNDCLNTKVCQVHICHTCSFFPKGTKRQRIGWYVNPISLPCVQGTWEFVW